MAKGSSGSMDMRTVMGWAIGVASIALLLLIMLILFGNLSGNVGFTQDSINVSVINESSFTVPTHANLTDYTLSGHNSSWSSITMATIFNASNGTAGGADFNHTISLANVTVSSVGVLTNATSAFVFDNISASYFYTHSFDTIGLANTNNFINNYTQSVLNTGEQFPTVGTIIGVGLLLFILIALLVFALGKMARMGPGSGGNFG